MRSATWTVCFWYIIDPMILGRDVSCTSLRQATVRSIRCNFDDQIKSVIQDVSIVYSIVVTRYIETFLFDQPSNFISLILTQTNYSPDLAQQVHQIKAEGHTCGCSKCLIPDWSKLFPAFFSRVKVYRGKQYSHCPLKREPRINRVL